MSLTWEVLRSGLFISVDVDVLEVLYIESCPPPSAISDYLCISPLPQRQELFDDMEALNIQLPEVRTMT